MLPTFEQPFESLDESGRRCAVNDVVIEVYRQAQALADFDAPRDGNRFRADAAKGDAERVRGVSNSPAAACAEHPNRSQRHRAGLLLPNVRVAVDEAIEDVAHKAGQEQKPSERRPAARVRTLLRVSLDGTDFIVQCAPRPAIDRAGRASAGIGSHPIPPRSR